MRGPQESVPLIEKVNEDRTPIEITSQRGDGALPFLPIGVARIGPAVALS
jgi:hypothetical protein